MHALTDGCTLPFNKLVRRLAVDHDAVRLRFDFIRETITPVGQAS